LGLRGSRHPPIDGKVIKKRFDIPWAKLKGMSFAVEENELAGPVSVSLLGISTEMSTAANDRKLLKQPRPIGGIVAP
jgi:hypothetical protein